MRERLPITAIILTWNEERHLARALDSLAFAERVVVVDSGSTDQTTAIAAAHGAEIVTRAFVSQADQFQWALDTLTIATPWTLRLDADEVIEPDLAENLRQTLPALGSDVTGVCFKRKHVFMGRWVRHGGRYPLVLLRLWRTGKGRVEARWMDEHVVVDEGRVITLDGGFADINLGDAAFFTDKHNRYATREALEVVLTRHGLHGTAETADGASAQARTKRWIKERVYNRLPFGLGPLAYFLWRFVFQLGFLDRREGRIYHVLQGFWYRFLVDVRRIELEQALSGAATREERLARLAAATGYAPEALAPPAAGCSSRRPTATAGLPE